MASDNKPHFAFIGFTVLIGVAAIVATLIYLGGFGGRDMEFMVESYYDKPVSGLSVGSAVNFRGVKIGEVRDITLVRPKTGDFSADDVQRIRIFMAINLRRMGFLKRPEDDEVRRMMESLIEHGLRATVASSGITGLSRIELNMVQNPPPVARLTWIPRLPLIPPAPSLIDSFSDVATRVMGQINKMDFVSVWSNVQSIAESTSHIMGNVDSLIESQKANLCEMMQNINEASARIDELARRLEENPSLLLRPADPEVLPETNFLRQ